MHQNRKDGPKIVIGV